MQYIVYTTCMVCTLVAVDSFEFWVLCMPIMHNAFIEIDRDRAKKPIDRDQYFS